MKKTLVVLAAGMGSRYGGLKQLDSVGPCGETIIEYSLYDAIEAGFEEIVFIIRKNFLDEFKEKISAPIESRVKVSFVFQDLNDLPGGFVAPDSRVKPWGTGHALYCAIKSIKSPFLIINGDDFYGTDAFRQAAASLDDSSPEDFTGGMIGYELENTLSENGSVSRGICSTDSMDRLVRVEETHGIRREEDQEDIASDNGLLPASAIASMNLWYFSDSVLPFVERYMEEFLEDNLQEQKAEFYLPSIVNHLITRESRNIDVRTTRSKWFGVTYREDRESVCAAIGNMVNDGMYPRNLWGNR